MTKSEKDSRPCTSNPPASLAPVWIVGFSGHRPNKDQPGRSVEALEGCRPLLETALGGFRQRAAAQGGTVHLYTSLAEGADCVAAEVAFETDVPVHVVLPLPIDEFRQDFPPGSPALEEMEKLLARVQESADGTVRVARGSRTRPECYYDAGLQILEASDAFLVVDNGEPAQGTGGTAEITKEAQAMGLPLIVIDPKDHTRRLEVRLDRFASSEEPGLRRMHELQDAARRRGMPVERMTRLTELFGALDGIANETSMISRRSAEWSVILSGLAALVGGVIVIYHEQLKVSVGAVATTVLTGIELLMVLAAFLLSRRVRWTHVRDVWVTARSAAELLRGYEGTAGILDPMTPLVTLHRKQWRRFALSAMLAAHREREGEDDIFARRDRYLTERLDVQRAYFQEHFERAQAQSRRARRVARAASLLAIPFVGGAFVLKVVDSARPDAPFYFEPDPAIALLTQFLPIALPLIAGIALALQQALDAGRRVHRYRAMAAELDAARKRIQHLQTPATIKRAIARVEGSLMEEQLEWQIASQSRDG